MSTSKMAEVAQELLNRSKSGTVNWQETGRKDVYRVVFPDVVLTVSLIYEFEDEGGIELKLGSETGRTIDSLASSSGEPQFPLLNDIFKLAEECVRDSSIEKALDYLKQS